MIDLTTVKKVPLDADRQWLVSLNELEHIMQTQGIAPDGGTAPNLFGRRRSMSTVIHVCKGIGLDIGCQRNKITLATIGIDRKGFNKCPWGPNIVHDGSRLGFFADGSLDYVYGGHVIEDMWDPVGCLREWTRVVKHEGFIAMLIPHADYYPRVGTPKANSDHKFDWWPSTIKGIVSNCFPNRLEIVQLESYRNKFDFDVILKVKKR